VAAFEYRLEDTLYLLREALSAGDYRSGGYRSFYVHEPKRRLISAAPFRDRVVHHALCQLIEPLFERRFVADSFANRIGKGSHRALDQAQHWARRLPYVLQVDVRQFFPSIDHAVLMGLLELVLDDEGLRCLCGRIIDGGAGVLDGEYSPGYFPGDDLFAVARPRGLPIGNLTSQFWANVMLNPLDHFIKRELRCPGYVRYADDLLLFGPSKSRLWAWKRGLDERAQTLRLRFHPGAHPRPVTEGIPFLGFVVYPQQRRLKRRKAVHFRRRLAGMLQSLEHGETSDEQVAASVRGWNNHARFGNTLGLRRSVFAPLPGSVREASRQRRSAK